MAKKVKRLYMAGYKGKQQVPYCVGEDGTQYSPDDYTAMANSPDFEIVESAVGMKVAEELHESAKPLGKGWTRDPNWKPKTYSGMSEAAAKKRVVKAFRLLGVDLAEADKVQREAAYRNLGLTITEATKAASLESAWIKLCGGNTEAGKFAADKDNF